MKRLICAAAVCALLIWIWAEYFRAIPHLAETGVQKNFKVQRQEPVSGEFTVLDKQFNRAGSRVTHSAAPVYGNFQRIEYLSNVDLLLSPPAKASMLRAQASWTMEGRCFRLQPKSGAAADLDALYEPLLHLSVIAANEQAASQLRRVKPGQRIALQGHWASAVSAKTGQPMLLRSALRQGGAGSCRLFLLDQIQTLS